MTLPTDVRCTFCKRVIKDGEYYSTHAIGREDIEEMFTIVQCEDCEPRWFITNDGGQV